MGMSKERALALYRGCGLTGAVAFAGVGIIFFLWPEGVVAFFNHWAAVGGLSPAPLAGSSLYLALAAAYMYLVALLAWQMYRHPTHKVYPRLLAHAKLASALLSLALFWLDAPYLIYLANFFVDAAIGVGAWALAELVLPGAKSPGGQP